MAKTKMRKKTYVLNVAVTCMMKEMDSCTATSVMNTIHRRINKMNKNEEQAIQLVKNGLSIEEVARITGVSIAWLSVKVGRY